MSIPLDRLYHYIQDAAEQVYNNDIVIYRFYPHGSKNINDLSQLKSKNTHTSYINFDLPEIVCNDQEVLNYEFYQSRADIRGVDSQLSVLYQQGTLPTVKHNLRSMHGSIYDKCILLHSEKNSVNVSLYRASHFIPVYYWAHAYIALDWFRYAAHITIQPAVSQRKFLIYNRAWAGAREYRLKFLELIQQNWLESQCQVSFNPVDPESGIHYSEHIFKNPAFKPGTITTVFSASTASSAASADFSELDYANTQIEVVLETLFDDDRIQLTEKILRPIACGHPFILVSTPGCLKYLRSYGFKTFSSVFDEGYDEEIDPVTRLKLIVDLMGKITQWSPCEQLSNLARLKEITDHNKQHFFSNEFFNTVDYELKDNLSVALCELENSNTSEEFIQHRQLLSQLPEPWITQARQRWQRDKVRLMSVLTKARGYYNRYLSTQ